jgi:hypothetical protein
MADDRKLPAKSAETEVAAFLAKVAAAPVPARGQRGRLLFVLDATASREDSWRQAQAIHAAMFQETHRLGGLEVQLAWYRGMGEFSAGPWSADADALLGQLGRVACVAGQTQIGRALAHAVAETRARKVHAVVVVADCMEEDLDRLGTLAGELGLLGTPVFLFHEGDDATAARAFAQLARLSGGACCRFDSSSPQQLKALLSAVAVYAAGGRAALMDFGRRQGGAVLQLTRQMGE